MDSNTRTAARYALVVSVGGFLFGFDASVISGVIGFVTKDFGLTALQQGLVVSAPTLAALSAAAAIGPVADRVGRKPVLFALAGLYAASALLSAMATGFETLVAARALGGIAFGTLVLAPVYIAEIAPASQRGKLVSINQLNIMIGFSVAYFANYFLLQLSQSNSGFAHTLGIDRHPWNWMLGLPFAPALIFMFFLGYIPESPRWLVLKGRLAQAREVLRKVAPQEHVENMIKDIQAGIERSVHETSSQFGALFHPKLRLILIVALVVAVAQQITGINAVYFYAPTIFEQSGVGTNAAFAQAIWIGLINLLFTVLAMATIDRLGRKLLLVIGLSGVLISMCLVAYGFHEARYLLTPNGIHALGHGMDTTGLQRLQGMQFTDELSFKTAAIKELGTQGYALHQAEIMKAAITINSTLVLAGILGFVASFAFSLGPVMWVLLSEIFPNRIRGLAISFVSFFNGLVSFLIQFLFPWELAALGSASTFLIYGGFALVSLILVALLLPETKGLTLEELENEMATPATR